ncbi:MAG: glycosyltransferase family 39 protein [Phycisphaerae bacterium]|nr:glycosyltransferase family 39 protein [Phycisphaerae bacterium]
MSVFVFIVAAGLRSAHYSAVRGTPFHDHHLHLFDAAYYDLLARHAIADGGLSDDVYFMAPLYPYVLAGVYRTIGGLSAEALHSSTGYGPEIHVAAYVQCLWGALTCVLIYWLGRRLGGNAVGIIAGLAAACYGPFIFHDSLLLATQLITFVNVAAMLVLLRAARGGALGWWLFGGLLLGLCGLAHGTALLLLPGVVLWILVGVPAQGWKEKLVRCAAVCGVAGACIVAVTIRNYVVGRDWVLLTSNSGLTFYIGNSPAATGSFQPLPEDLLQIPGVNLGWHLRGFRRGPDDPRPSEISRDLRSRTLAAIADDPSRFLKLLWRKFCLFWNAVEVGTADHYYFYKVCFSPILRWPLISFGVLGPIALTGLVCSLRRRREYFLLYVWMAIQVGAFTLMFVLGRYRLVAVAGLFVWAGFQIVWWIDALRAKRYRAVGLTLLPLAVFSLLVHQPLTGFTPRRGWGEQFRLLGVRHKTMQQDQEAIALFQRALEHDFAPRQEDDRRVICLMSLATLYGKQQRWDDVLAVGGQAQELLDRMSDSNQNTSRRQWLEEAIRRAHAARSLP